MTNIVYIHTHDTGRVLSPYGHATPTPQLQAWFEDAITFEQAYSVAPTCSPSRAGLLTGMYPHQNGMLGLAQRGFELDTSKHLARFLSENGYRTALCGVQHEYAYYLDHDLAYAELGYAEDLSADHRGYAESDLVYWDAENADNLSRWLVQNAGDDTPFFVSFGMHATHRAFPTAEFPAPFPASPVPPASVPNDAASRADYAGYLTSAKFADDAVGRVLTALKAAGRYDDTIVLVTTDHGIPYPGHKGTLTAAGTGVMLGVRVPGAAHGRGEYDGLISQIDIFPTLCDLVGLPAPEHLEGRSFAPLFRDGEHAGDAAVFAETNFHTSYEPARGVRTARWDYIRYFDQGWARVNLSNIDSSPTKDLQVEAGLAERVKPMEQLYDVILDPGEKNNLADDPALAGVLEEMRGLLHRHMVATADPLLDGPIPIDPAWKVNKSSAVSASSKAPEDYISLGAPRRGSDIHSTTGDKQ